MRQRQTGAERWQQLDKDRQVHREVATIRQRQTGAQRDGNNETKTDRCTERWQQLDKDGQVHREVATIRQKTDIRG